MEVAAAAAALCGHRKGRMEPSTAPTATMTLHAGQLSAMNASCGHKQGTGTAQQCCRDLFCSTHSKHCKSSSL